MLLNALKDNTEKFEKKFGEIKIAGEVAGGQHFGFHPPQKDEKFH
jgi:hypothetical protein